MLNIICPICKIDKTKEIFAIGDLDRPLRNVICTSCGLVYINPRPDENEYLAYQGSSRRGSGHHSCVTINLTKEKIEQNDLRIKEKIFKFIFPYIRKENRILDIGCGFGTLLHTLNDRIGLSVEGVELNKNDVRLAKEFFGLNIFCGTLEAFHKQYAGVRKYDLIILHHTLEHFLDPFAEFLRIKDLLVANGIFYIGVPNILNMKKRPENFFQFGHAVSYSPHSLRLILKKAGFKVVKFNRKAGYPGGMELLAANAASDYAEFLNKQLERGSNWQEVYNYVQRSKKRYRMLRFLRAILLFWLPKQTRIKISRPLYKILKRL